MIITRRVASLGIFSFLLLCYVAEILQAGEQYFLIFERQRGCWHRFGARPVTAVVFAVESLSQGKTANPQLLYAM
jgi:hypothetical protein